jgi:hypothetical protein
MVWNDGVLGHAPFAPFRGYFLLGPTLTRRKIKEHITRKSETRNACLP